MKNNFSETPLLVFLRQQQIAHRLLLQDKPANTIEEAAKLRGIRPCQMVKCILLRDMDNQYALACVPGHLSVDPKKVRAHLGWKRMTCASSEHVWQITGYQTGTVTPLLLKTPLPVLFDPAIQNEQEITISSGHLMAGIAMSSRDLVTLVNPVFTVIHRNNPQ
ncbi:Cys-tRNA(Pro)/Cys-tRNA(Cys) deacylase YbaK [Vibrio aerogenes CECT 7868]|uniref:Cys-tRNA(Pro)/Cys-tRNA(Cys) deacylase YbaK n=1 Tax=Vibrio aerogenes CECT 7868 TaxID=1216006 RepID=A0A1M5YIB8_9VIBR|nr:YbaK/EbsC family protein [Vibrio aerogenes]SHI11797.1 Cys-tRNA(Pro)/Cys-tRNA(Cys) deacylase YbaK [Vibrio aerogenes CECT 7868]